MTRKALQHSLIEICRRVEPGISDAEIARRFTVSRAAVCAREFNVQKAISAWNSGGHRALLLVPAYVLCPSLD
jgi:hypothetical protein